MEVKRISEEGEGGIGKSKGKEKTERDRFIIYFALDRYIRQGCLGEDDKVLYIGWRTRAEVDRKSLLDLILAS